MAFDSNHRTSWTDCLDSGEHVFQCLSLQHNIPGSRVYCTDGGSFSHYSHLHHPVYGHFFRQNRKKKALYDLGLCNLGAYCGPLCLCIPFFLERSIHCSTYSGNTGLCHDILRLHGKRCRLQRLCHRKRRGGKEDQGGKRGSDNAYGCNANSIWNFGWLYPEGGMEGILPYYCSHNAHGRYPLILLH